LSPNQLTISSREEGQKSVAAEDVDGRDADARNEVTGLVGALVVPFDARRGKILVLGDRDRSCEVILDRGRFGPTRETDPACALLQLQDAGSV